MVTKEFSSKVFRVFPTLAGGISQSHTVLYTEMTGKYKCLLN